MLIYSRRKELVRKTLLPVVGPRFIFPNMSQYLKDRIIINALKYSEIVSPAVLSHLVSEKNMETLGLGTQMINVDVCPLTSSRLIAR